MGAVVGGVVWRCDSSVVVWVYGSGAVEREGIGEEEEEEEEEDEEEEDQHVVLARHGRRQVDAEHSH